MKVLKDIKEVFVWLSLCSTDRFEGKMKYLPAATTATSIVMLSWGFTSSALFFWQSFEERHVAHCFQSLLQCDGIFLGIYMLIVGIIIRRKLMKIFTKFQELRDASK